MVTWCLLGVFNVFACLDYKGKICYLWLLQDIWLNNIVLINLAWHMWRMKLSFLSFSLLRFMSYSKVVVLGSLWSWWGAERVIAAIVSWHQRNVVLQGKAWMSSSATCVYAYRRGCAKLGSDPAADAPRALLAAQGVWWQFGVEEHDFKPLGFLAVILLP